MKRKIEALLKKKCSSGKCVPQKKKIGILEGKASFKINGNFKITDQELLTL